MVHKSGNRTIIGENARKEETHMYAIIATGGKQYRVEVGTELEVEKLDIFTYKPKKNIRKRQGHRQPYTKIKITSI